MDIQPGLSEVNWVRLMSSNERLRGVDDDDDNDDGHHYENAEDIGY